MKKPSERITEIYRKQKLETPNFTPEGNFIESILTYLDEEWTKQQPCKEHQYVDIAGLGEVCERCFKTRITPV